MARECYQERGEAYEADVCQRESLRCRTMRRVSASSGATDAGSWSLCTRRRKSCLASTT
ncbi:hypothetical protein [Mitsuokella multacida]|uniref:hypothetical protein n=1 Tax=Mitsuokella multacida TaxID=52226 RepID=UPI003F5EBEF9